MRGNCGAKVPDNHWKKIILGLLFIVGAWSSGQTPPVSPSVKIEDIWYLLEETGAYQQALDLCEKGLQQTSPDAQPILFAQLATAKGNALRQLGRPLEAIPAHLTALAIRRQLKNPNACLTTCRNIANCWLDKNGADSAWIYIEEGMHYIKAMPEPDAQGDFWETTGNYWESKRNWPKAIQYWKKALFSAGSADDSLRLNLSLVAGLGQIGQHQKAMDILSPYLAAAPSHPNQWTAIWRTAGLHFRNTGAIPTAVGYLERALKTAPDSTEQSQIGLDLGDAYLEMGDFSTGIDVFEKILNNYNDINHDI